MALRQENLAEKLKNRWERDEWWAAYFLRLTGLAKSTAVADMRIFESLPRIDYFRNLREAESFLEAIKKRTVFLTTDEAEQRLGTVKCLAYSYTESRVFRRAVKDGVYFTSAA